MLGAKKDRSEELRNAILQLNIFSEIDGDLLDDNDGYIKNFLHTLCPKHIYEIDEIIKKTPIDKKRLKKIIENSIYNELNAFLQSGEIIYASKAGIDINRNVICTNVGIDYHSVNRVVSGDADFSYIPKTNSCWFSDFKRRFSIKTCGDNNGEISIKCHDSGDEQKITDDNLTKLAKKCLVFLKSVSLVELKKYYQTFTSNIKQEKEEKLPSPKTIISAMQNAQKTVEEMRKKEENKEEKNEENKEKEENKKEKEVEKEEEKKEEEMKEENKEKEKKKENKKEENKKEKEVEKEKADINNKPAETNIDNAQRCFGTYNKNGKTVYRCFGVDIPCL